MEYITELARTKFPDVSVAWFAFYASIVGLPVFKCLQYAMRYWSRYWYRPPPVGFAPSDHGAWLGAIERFFFVYAIVYGYAFFPFVWLGLKVGVQSNSWKTKKTGRKRLDAYLILSLISIGIGFVFAWLALGAPGRDELALRLE